MKLSRIDGHDAKPEVEAGRALGNGSKLISKATGPTTQQGKQRASRNAIKFGVFSKVILLPGESRTEYSRLLARLWEAWQPEGAREELEVEKMATTTWRQRRGFLAEGAEIRKNMEFVESDQRDREREQAERIVRLSSLRLIRNIHNPNILEHCLELLAELREHVNKHGFDDEYDSPILARIYGLDEREMHLHEDLYDSYNRWVDTSETSEEERRREGYASPAQCRKNVLKEIDEEIRRLKREQEAHASIEATRTQLKTQCRYVPKERALDRLPRYEAHLDRSFDRSQSRLERFQRMRLRQPVLPELKVRHSLS